MISYKNIVDQSITKTGLDISLANKDESHVTVTIAAGNIVKDGIPTGLMSEKNLDIKVSGAVDTEFYVMLVSHSITQIADVVIMQRSNKSRRIPTLAEFNYNLVELLAKGSTKRGAADISNVECEINNWV